MEHKRIGNYNIRNRIGFHYFPDSLHYREKDLSLWLPRLKALDTAFLVLKSPTTRAVPEDFITALSKEKIDIIMDFDLPLSEKIAWADLETLLRAYGKWGVKYALLNQQPNSQSAWGDKYWKQKDLVKSYTQQFMKFAELSLDNGIKPVFSPLVPGGDYWDTAFLKEALQIISKSADSRLINNMLLSAYGWDFGKSLDWGSGGQKTWKSVKPYRVPSASQDQRGFRAYEWYQQCVHDVLGKSLPVMLFQAGIEAPSSKVSHSNSSPVMNRSQQIYHLLKGRNVYDPDDRTKLVSAITPQVLACNFYLLSAGDATNEKYAWFNSQGAPSKTTREIMDTSKPIESRSSTTSSATTAGEKAKNAFKYGRYVLIAESLKPNVQEVLKSMHAYIARYKPVVGFSTEEARQSAYILVVANNNDFSEAGMQQLRQNGSLIKVIQPEEIKVSLNP